MTYKLKQINLKFEPRDLWVGLFWDKNYNTSELKYSLKLYFISIPTLVLILNFEKDILGE